VARIEEVLATWTWAAAAQKIRTAEPLAPPPQLSTTPPLASISAAHLLTTSWVRPLGFRWPRQAGAMVPCSRSSLPTRMTAATSLVDFSSDGAPSHQKSSTPPPPPRRPYAGCWGGQLGLLECELSTIAVSAIIMNPIDITKVGRPSLPGTSPSLSRCKRGSSRDADL
jgi:hypothetical protein